MTDWEQAYFEYRDIENPLEKQEYRRNLDFSQGILDNVYEAAFILRRYRNNHENWYYRGQNDLEYRLRPSMFRKDVNDFEYEVRKLSSLVRYLQQELKISKREALAVAKHYSGVLEQTTVRSWLIDITDDPLIACFFATHGDNLGESGQIFIFKSDEMDRYSTDGPKQMGEVEIISPENVPRIQQQEACFINKAHPDLLEKYIPLNHAFQQKPDIRFEDPELSITADELLPVGDEYNEVMEKWEDNIWPEDLPPSKIVSPPHFPTDYITKSDYLEMIKEWMEQDYDELDPDSKQCLEDLCAIHEDIQASERISISVKSEIQLRQTLNLAQGMSEEDSFSFDWVVSRLWHESSEPDTDREAIKEAIEQVRPDYQFERDWC